MPPKKGSKRPPTCYFDPMKLFRALEPLAKLRQVGFQWNGSEYTSHKRGLSVDVAGLKMHEALLRELLKAAPSGFPSYARLRTCLTRLHDEYQVYAGAPDCEREILCGVDRMRIMSKDCYELAKDPNKAAKARHEVAGLIALVDLDWKPPAPDAPAGDASDGGGESTESSVDDDSDDWDDADGECHVVAVVCRFCA